MSLSNSDIDTEVPKEQNPTPQNQGIPLVGRPYDNLGSQEGSMDITGHSRSSSNCGSPADEISSDMRIPSSDSDYLSDENPSETNLREGNSACSSDEDQSETMLLNTGSTCSLSENPFDSKWIERNSADSIYENPFDTKLLESNSACSYNESSSDTKLLSSDCSHGNFIDTNSVSSHTSLLKNRLTNATLHDSLANDSLHEDSYEGNRDTYGRDLSNHFVTGGSYERNQRKKLDPSEHNYRNRRGSDKRNYCVRCGTEESE